MGKIFPQVGIKTLCNMALCELLQTIANEKTWRLRLLCLPLQPET